MKLIQTRDVFEAAGGPNGGATLSRLSVLYDGDLAYGVGRWQPVASDDLRGPLEFGFVVEDEDRGLDASMPLSEIERLKVKKETAIPVGEYVVRRTFSRRFKRIMLLVMDVPGFAGIRIHPGRDEGDTEGCLLVCLRRDIGTMSAVVGTSKPACAWLEDRVAECEARGEEVRLVVQRDPAAWAAFAATGGARG